MSSFYSNEELAQLGLKSYGKNVLLSRHTHIYSPEKISIGNSVRIDDFSILSGDITIGSHVHIASYCGMFGIIVMEDYSAISSKVSLYARSDDYSGEYMTNPMVHPNYTKLDVRPIVIKKHAIIGAGSVVLPNTTLHEGAVLGALSLGKGELESFWIYGGTPAKKVKERSRKLLELEHDMAVTK